MNVTLRDGCIAPKVAVDEIFFRVMTATRKPYGRDAFEQLADVALGIRSSICNEDYAKLLHNSNLLTTSALPIRKEHIFQGPDGLTSSVIVSSIRWARDISSVVCPYQQGPN